MTGNFEEQLAYSRIVEPWQTGVLKLYLKDYVKCDRASFLQDIAGTDYIVTLYNGLQQRVDFKHRCFIDMRFLTNDPDIQVEHEGWAQKAGCDYYLFTFNPAQLPVAYYVDAARLKEMLPFLLDADAFGNTIRTVRDYRNGKYVESECMFIPASKLLDALGEGYATMWAFDLRSVQAGTDPFPLDPTKFYRVKTPKWWPEAQRAAMEQNGYDVDNDKLLDSDWFMPKAERITRPDFMRASDFVEA